MKKYVKISLLGGGSYVQPMDRLMDAIDGEMDGAPKGTTIKLVVVEMSDEEYRKLPEFTGH